MADPIRTKKWYLLPSINNNYIYLKIYDSSKVNERKVKKSGKGKSKDY